MKQVYIVLTETCNLACSHCIRESSPMVKTAMSLDEALHVLDSVGATYPESEILLTGGEPTIHRHFPQILDRALRSGQYVMVNSNGITPFYSTETLKRYVAHPQLAFQVSLDGAEHQHDTVRGPGTYQRALKTLALLCEMGFRVCVSATVMSERFFGEIEAFLTALDELGLGHIAIKRATYAGRAASGDELTTEGWNNWVRRVRQAGYRTKLHVSPMFDFEALNQFSEDELRILAPSVVKNCGSGTEKIYVYPNLDLCACTCFKSLPMGNLKRSSLSQIMAEQRPLEVRSATCEACRFLTLCQGGCLGSGYQYTGELGAPDPRCPKLEVARQPVLES